MRGPLNERSRRRVILAIVLLAGCNSVFGIEETASLPPVDVDLDDDGVPDDTDNCPDAPNPLQSDDDGDSLGDVCDNCPLVENADQADVEADTVGDLCDPNPLVGGDCLALYESFDDETSLASRWQVESNMTPDVVAFPGGLHVTGPLDLQHTALFPLDEAGARLTGAFNVQALALTRSANSSAEVGVATNVTTVGLGYVCSAAAYAVTGTPGIVAAYAADSSSMEEHTDVFTSTPVGDRMLLRLVPRTLTGVAAPRCRIEHGVALGVAILSSRTVIADVTDGSPAVIVWAENIDLLGVALYRFTPDATSCPAAEYR